MKKPRKSNVRLASFAKILTHPDKNLIIRLLTKGEGVRAVAKHIRERYPDDRGLHISVPTLQAFRKDKLNLQGEVLNQIKEAEKEKKEIKDIQKEGTILRKSPAYKEAIHEAANIHVDIRTELAEMIKLIKFRIEDLFDRAAEGRTTVNEEANLQKYFPILGASLDKWMKYVEKVADKTIETNINITFIESQMAIMREAVKETLAELDPDLVIKFLDNLNKKLDSIDYRKPRDVNFETMHKQVRELSERIQDAELEEQA